jgi:hypothetical protein
MMTHLSRPESRPESDSLRAGLQYSKHHLVLPLQVSMRHLECVRGLLAHGDVRVQELLAGAEALLARSYALLTTGQLHQLRQTLLGFMQVRSAGITAGEAMELLAVYLVTCPVPAGSRS